MKELAREAGVATATVTRLEAGLPSHAHTRLALRKALETAGVLFIRRRDGEGVLLTHATECVFDLIDISRGAANRGGLEVAISARIDRYLQASATWQKEWRLASRTHYVRELVRRIRSETKRAEPRGAEVLKLALRYIHAGEPSPALHKD